MYKKDTMNSGLNPSLVHPLDPFPRARCSFHFLFFFSPIVLQLLAFIYNGSTRQYQCPDGLARGVGLRDAFGKAHCADHCRLYHAMGGCLRMHLLLFLSS